MVLAGNSIVVTTYATIAKEATFPTTNNDNIDDCGPCEKVRWWRIICDESHALKQDTAQTKAILNLVGDHKWAVSGTWRQNAQLRFLIRTLTLVYVLVHRHPMEYDLDGCPEPAQVCWT